MSQERLKIDVARAALGQVEDGMLLGVGTGSTVNAFIGVLAQSGKRIEAAVSSSEATTERLRAIGIEVVDLNQAGTLDLYIDGADEFDGHRRLIKGGGGALTQDPLTLTDVDGVEVAIEEEVAFMLLAGDLYDGDWKDYNTGLFFTGQMARLQEAGIRIYVVAGNHDAASQLTKALRPPQNVHVFSTRSPETAVLEDLGVAVHGQGQPVRR